jgi:hypothetical protein
MNWRVFSSRFDTKYLLVTLLSHRMDKISRIEVERGATAFRKDGLAVLPDPIKRCELSPSLGFLRALAYRQLLSDHFANHVGVAPPVAPSHFGEGLSGSRHSDLLRSSWRGSSSPAGDPHHVAPYTRSCHR